jgi:mannosyltransferase OCH1-like enzyme
MIRIPKILHFVWVGNEALRPNNCIDSWRRLNPDYKVIVWGNDLFAQTPWYNIEHIHDMIPRELNGVADMMRYEILYHHGGIALDADSFCVRALEDWLIEPTEFACWESEVYRPGLIGCNAIGSIPGSPFIGQIIQDISNEKTVIHDMAWKTVGPLRITNAWNKYKFPLTIYPSHYFSPNHFAGTEYAGNGPVFAKQLWGSTHQSYGNLEKIAG